MATKRTFEVAFDMVDCIGPSTTWMLQTTVPIVPAVPIVPETPTSIPHVDAADNGAEPAECVEPMQSMDEDEDTDDLDGLELFDDDEEENEFEEEFEEDGEDVELIAVPRCHTPDPMTLLTDDALALRMLLDSECQYDQQNTMPPSSPRLPSPLYTGVTASTHDIVHPISFEHAGVLSEYGGVKEWMKTL